MTDTMRSDEFTNWAARNLVNGDDYEGAWNAYQAALTSPSIIKLIEALKYIAERDWTAETKQADKWIREFCDMAKEALSQWQDRGVNAGK